MAKRMMSGLILAGMLGLALATWHAAAAKEDERGESKKVALPEKVVAAIHKTFGKATIAGVERENEGVTLYEVKLRQYGAELEAKLAADGTVVEVERNVAEGELPKAVAQTLRKHAGDAKVGKIERAESHAAVRLVKLAKPEIVYEAKVVRDGREVELKIRADGKLLGQKVEDEDNGGRKGKDDDEEGDDEGEHEKKVDLDGLPDAVRATILKQAGKHRVREVELVTKDGRKCYEAEWVVDGKEVEVRVAPGGKLLGRKVEDADDENDEHDDD